MKAHSCAGGWHGAFQLRRRIGAGFALRGFDVVVAAVEGEARFGPEPAHNLDGPFELFDALAGCRKPIAVGEVLVFVSPRAETQDEPSGAQELKRRSHLGDERRVAERLAEHRVAEPELRMKGREVGEGGERLQPQVTVGLEVVLDPCRLEPTADQVQRATDVSEKIRCSRSVSEFRWHREPELNRDRHVRILPARPPL
jgi:hypothetical protein